MLDPRVIAGVALMGIVAVLAKVIDLYQWHLNRRPVIDTSTNGGVKRASFIP